MLEKIGMVLFGAAIGFIATWYWKRKERVQKQEDDAKRDRRADDTRISDLEKRVAELSAQVSPFWSAIQAKIIKDLTHPSPQFAPMDRLLAKLLSLQITPLEHRVLDRLIEERIVSTDPEITEEEKSSAKILKLVIPKVIAEAEDSMAKTIAP